MAPDESRDLPTQVAQVVCNAVRNSVVSEREHLSFALARAVIERHPAARALPRVDDYTERDRLLRELTAGKGYTPDDCCPACGRRVGIRDQVAIEAGTVVYHAVCR